MKQAEFHLDLTRHTGFLVRDGVGEDIPAKWYKWY